MNTLTDLRNECYGLEVQIYNLLRQLEEKYGVRVENIYLTHSDELGQSYRKVAKVNIDIRLNEYENR